MKTKDKDKATLKHRITELRDAGLTHADIGKILDLHKDTVGKYLKEIGDTKRLLQTFQDTLGDCLKTDLLFGMILKHNLLITLTNEDVSSMSLSDKRQLIRDLSVSNGTTFDKIRLQDGKSTSNSAHHIQVELAHQHLNYGPTPTSQIEEREQTSSKRNEKGEDGQNDGLHF